MPVRRRNQKNGIGTAMAKKKSPSFIASLEKTVTDMADAVSVAATGSQIGILELAVEDELHLRPSPRKAKKAAKTAGRKKAAAKKKPVAAKTSTKPIKARKTSPRKPVKKKRAVKRR